MRQRIGLANKSVRPATSNLQRLFAAHIKLLLSLVGIGCIVLGATSAVYAHHLNGRFYWYAPAQFRAGIENFVPNPVGNGNDQLIAGSYYSAAMEHKVGYMVYLPPDYDPNGAPYPVIYFLHGILGLEVSYIADNYSTSAALYQNTNLISLVAQAHTSASPRDTIIVFVNGGKGSFYLDYDGFTDINGQDHHSSNIAPRYPNGAGDPFPDPWPDNTLDFRILSRTTIIEELIPHIDASYNTIANRSGRAIEGFSMGGGGAWRLALQHPELFCSSIAYAPAGLDRIPQNAWPLYGGPLLPRDAASALSKSNIGAIVANNLKLRTVTGAMDEDAFYNDSITVRNALVANGLPASNIEIVPRPTGVGHSMLGLNNAVGAASFDFHWDCFEGETTPATPTPRPPTPTPRPPTPTPTPRPPTPTPTPTPPTPTPTSTSSADVILADSFETGNLSLWSAAAVDGGDLSVTSQAALVGGRGLRAVLDDNASIYVTDDRPTGESGYRARFYFDPNTIRMTNGDGHFIFGGFFGTSRPVLRLELGYASGRYQIRAALLTDATTWRNTSWFAISDAAHFTEVFWKASSGPGANNGQLHLWIDGVQRAGLTGVDNDTSRIDRILLGAVGSLDAGTRGVYFFDAFESRRQTYIGSASGTQPASIEAPVDAPADFYTWTEEPDFPFEDNISESPGEMTNSALYLPMLGR